MGGSNPPLLRESARWFVIGVVLAFYAQQPDFTLNAVLNSMEVIMQTIVTFKAVFVSSIQSFFSVSSAVAAGLAASGRALHL